MQRWVGMVICSVTLVLAACGSNADDTQPQPDTSLTEATAPPAAGDALPLPAGDEAVLEVTLRDDALALAADSVQAGVVSLRISNGGTRTHRLRLSGNGDEVETDDLEPNEEVTMSLSLSAGTYQARCPVAGHTHGAAATLTVR